MNLIKKSVKAWSKKTDNDAKMPPKGRVLLRKTRENRVSRHTL